MTELYDRAAEAALLGDLMLSGERVHDVVNFVRPEDFYRPAHRTVYSTIIDLWRAGVPTDQVNVVSKLKAAGQLEDVGGTAALVDLAGAAVGGYRGYARTVVRYSLARRVMAAGVDITEAAADPAADPAEVLDRALASLRGIDVPTGRPPADLYELDAFLDRPAEHQSQWVVPGLLRQSWRTILVAPEGTGKSVVFRQFAICCAQGIHPFSFTVMPRRRVLLVDLENPDDAITDMCVPVRDQARRQVAYESGRAWLWHRPGGVDLRSRASRAEFESVLVACRPDLVCLGPLYKAYRVQAKESDELAAGEVQHVLDDLRTRYGFGLMIEHHAPKAQGGHRELLPYGSSLWLRWPEQGIKLLPDAGYQPRNHRLLVDRWRGDRLPAAWPDALERSTVWPWVGVWNDGGGAPERAARTEGE